MSKASQLLAATSDANERAYLLEAYADWSGRPAFVEAWAAAGDPIGVLVRGIHSVVWAWEARGSRGANSVSASGANLFFERLELAKADLIEAGKRLRADATACAWLTKVGRGLGDRDLADKAFAEGKQRAPGLRSLHSSMLQLTCAKWGGSDAEMFDFAREHAASAPRGSGLQVLIAEAHMEYHLQLSLNDPQRKLYYANNADELMSAARACFAPGSGCTAMNAVRNHNYFARVLWAAGRLAEARPHFEVIGKTPNTRPWEGFVWWIDWLLNPFKKARRECLRASASA